MSSEVTATAGPVQQPEVPPVPTMYVVQWLSSTGYPPFSYWDHAVVGDQERGWKEESFRKTSTPYRVTLLPGTSDSLPAPAPAPAGDEEEASHIVASLTQEHDSLQTHERSCQSARKALARGRALGANDERDKCKVTIDRLTAEISNIKAICDCIDEFGELKPFDAALSPLAERVGETIARLTAELAQLRTAYDVQAIDFQQAVWKRDRLTAELERAKGEWDKMSVALLMTCARLGVLQGDYPASSAGTQIVLDEMAANLRSQATATRETSA